MKKYLLVGLFLVGTVFTGCDFFIDEVALHNDIVRYSDAVMVAEEGFYDEYWSLAEGVDTAPFVESYVAFSESAAVLETFVAETKFTSRQMPIINEYSGYYKPVLDGYIEAAGVFTEEVKENGYNFEALEAYFEEIDEYTLTFVSADDSFAAVTNALSDYSL